MRMIILWTLLGSIITTWLAIFFVALSAMKCRYPKIKQPFNLEEHESRKKPIKKHLIAMAILILVAYVAVTIIAVLMCLNVNDILGIVSKATA